MNRPLSPLLAAFCLLPFGCADEGPETPVSPELPNPSFAKPVPPAVPSAASCPAPGCPSYHFEHAWGTPGSGLGQLDHTHSVAVYKNKYVYVTDRFNYRVQKFDLDGDLLTMWGGPGSGEGEFGNAHNIALDKAGNVYVVDFGNHRIQKFDADGNFLLKWGSFGMGDGQFDRPWGIAVDKSGDVYVTDSGNHRIQVFTSEGVFLRKWGSFCDLGLGTGCANGGEGQFYYPSGIAVDKKGFVYVGDGYNHRMQKFTNEGVFVHLWGGYCSMLPIPGGTCVDPDGSGPLEVGDGQFLQITGVSLDVSGRLYVADAWNHRIQKFDLEGNFLTKFGAPGSGHGELNLPWSVSVARNKRVYVGDHFNHRVQVFSAPGKGD